MEHARLASRKVIEISGADRKHFLQGLITNDIEKVSPTHAIYALMLTPQGKFLFDFFIIEKGESFLLDVEAGKKEEILKKLKMYKLRSSIDIKETDYNVFQIFSGDYPDVIVFNDPRSAGILGKRAFAKELRGTDKGEAYYDALRVEKVIPEGGKDLFAEKSFPLQNNMDEVGAIDYNKGCYVGQEVTARSKHRGVIRKRVQKFETSGAAKTGDAIKIEGKQVGEILSVSGNKMLALVDFEELEKAPGKAEANGTNLK